MESWHAILISAGASALTGLIIYFLTRRDRKAEAKSERDKWVGAVNSDRKIFKEFIHEIRDDVREIRQDIKSIFVVLRDQILKAQD